jgi:hypothetical protein
MGKMQSYWMLKQVIFFVLNSYISVYKCTEAEINISVQGTIDSWTVTLLRDGG